MSRIQLSSPTTLKNKSQGKIFRYFFAAAILFLIYLFSNGFLTNSYAIQYIALWLFFSIIFLFFINNVTFIAKLDGKPSILEMPVYVTVLVMGLITIFGVVPLMDHSLLLSGISEKNVIDGLVLNCLGLLSLWIGYAFVVKLPPFSNEHLNKPSDRNLENPNLSIALIIYGLVTLLRFVLILRGGGGRIGGSDILNLSSWEQWLEYIFSTSYFFVALFSIQYARGKLNVYLFIIIIVIEVFITMISGWASNIIQLGIVVLGTQILFKKTNILLFLIIGAFLSVLVVPMIRNFRSIDVSSVVSIVEGIQTTNEQINISSRLNYSQDLLIRRQVETSQVPALIMVKTPQLVGYRPIEELLDAPISFIPRVLWPNKPDYGFIGKWATIVYFGYLYSTSTAITPAGGFYIYGGYLFVILGMLITGVVCAVYTRVLAVPSIKNSQIALLAMYIGTTVYVFHLAENNYLQVIPVIIQTTIVYLGVVLLISYRKRRTFQ